MGVSAVNDPRSRRHTVQVMRDAQRLRDAGWSIAKIAELLGVGKGTVMRWTNPEFDAQQRRRRNLRVLPGCTFRLGGSSPTHEYKLAFASQLINEGVPVSSVAKVMTVVFGEPWSRYRVARDLRANEAVA